MIRETLRDYIPRLARQWWTLLGITSSLIGYVLSIAVGLHLSPLLWVGLFAASLTVAQVVEYHKLRLVSAPSDFPALPQWAAWVTHANADGCWLSVVAYGRPASPWTSARYQYLKEAVSRFSGLALSELGGRSYANGAELRWPVGNETPVLHCQVGIDGIGVAVFQWRTTDNPVKLRWVLRWVAEIVTFMTSDEIARIIRSGKDRSCIVALTNWPEEGVDPTDLLSDLKRTDQWVRGYRLDQKYALDRKVDPWTISLHFASQLLADGGYVEYEHRLGQLQPDRVLALESVHAVTGQ
jgi:hypothetical protein